MKKRKPCLTIILCLIMIFSLIGIPINAYASQWRLSTTKVSLQPKEKCTLFVDNGKKTLSNKKIKWSSSKKKIASVSKKGVVRAKKTGICYIKAKVGTKVLKCKIKVKKQTGYMPRSDKYYEKKRAQTYKQIGIKKSMKPQYKCFLIAKWECDYMTYKVHSSIVCGYAWGLDKKTGQCSDYAELYQYMIQGLKIPVKYIDNGLHAYNQVKIDGKWYAVDVTCMDQASSIKDCNNDEGVRYDMSQFLVPDSFTGFGYKSMGATSRRFVKAIYGGLIAHQDYYFKKLNAKVDTDGSIYYEYIDQDGEYCYVDTGLTIVSKCGWDSKGNYTEDPYKAFIDAGDYRFNPWFTGKWINY